MSMLLPDWLARRAASSPHAPAIMFGATTLSFRDLEQRVAHLAGQLAVEGASIGARIALLAGNSPEFASAVHAMPRLGTTLVPLNWRLSAGELVWQLRDCAASLLLYDGEQQALATTLQAELPELRGLSLAELAAGRAAPAPPQPIDLSATHTIIYTSGTTGRPKGALLSYGNHWWSATASALNLGHQPDDRWLAVLPLFHVGGLSILLRSAIYGICAEIQPRFSPEAANAAIDNGVTIVSVVTAMLQRMLDARGEQPYPPHLRCVLLGGGPAPQPLLQRCAALGVPVVQTYGLTESASQAVTLSPHDALRKLGSAGQPLLPMELRIASEAGAVGEILLRGPMITQGYLNRPEANAAALRDGWLHTGDLGYLDEEGYLYVIDRRDDLIISGGENIYPAEVEAALLAHPAISEAAVVGQSDPQWGQVPVAFIVLRVGHTTNQAEILAFVGERLARYKLPRQIHFRSELPRTASGKIRRIALREGSG